MAKLSKKQRVALKEIDKLAAERKRDRIMAIASIVVMAILIVGYNTLRKAIRFCAECFT